MMHARRSRWALTPRPAFVLFTTLVAIVIVALLIGTLAFQSAETGRLARLTTLHHAAMASAEGGGWSTFAAVDVPTLRAAPIGTVTRTTTTSGELIRNVTVIKIDTTMVWIVAAATIQRGRERGLHRIALSAMIPSDTSRALSPLPGAPWVDLY